MLYNEVKINKAVRALLYHIAERAKQCEAEAVNIEPAAQPPQKRAFELCSADAEQSCEDIMA